MKQYDDSKHFIEAAKSHREAFYYKMSKGWLSITPADRVAVEDILIYYDQLVDRYETVTARKQKSNWFGVFVILLGALLMLFV